MTLMVIIYDVSLVNNDDDDDNDNGEHDAHDNEARFLYSIKHGLYLEIMIKHNVVWINLHLIIQEIYFCR